MKKLKFIVSICLVLCLSLLLVGCSSDYIKKNSTGLDTYTINASVDTVNKKVSATEVLKFTNNCDIVLKQLMFHIYPNAYRSSAKIQLLSKDCMLRAYPNGISYGDITIDSVKVGGEQVAFIIGGTDFDILEVPLLKDLYTGETVEVEIVFTVKLANVKHRMGYAENTINMGNWYPILCDMENNVFLTTPYYQNGDPFSSKMSNYNVTIRLDKNYSLASSGELLETTQIENDNIYKIVGTSVRDFAFVMSDKFTILTETVDGVKLNYYYFKDTNPKDSMKIAVDSLNTFNKEFGKYPYKTMSVVETDFCHGGMEYPNLIYITTGLDKEFYQQVIVHEIAHQWWYGIVGNNQVKNAWMDEGLTEFSTAYFYKLNPSYNVSYGMMLLKTTKTYVRYIDIKNAYDKKVDTSMNRAVNEFASENEYVLMTYNKGFIMFDSLMETMGSKKFSKGLKNYFEANKCKIAKPEDMIASFEKAFGAPLESWFDAWLSGKVVVGQRE